MAYRVVEIHEDETCDINYRGEQEITHVRSFYVVTDDLSWRPVNAISAIGVPQGGEPHPIDTNAYVISKSVHWHAKGGDEEIAFKVVVNYSDDAIDNPLNKPDEIAWGGSETTESYFFDAVGNPCVNSAGESFEELLQREGGEINATVTRNVAIYPVVLAYQYRQTVNTDAFTLQGVTIPIGYAKIGVITATPLKRENEIWHQTMTIPIKFRAPLGEDDPKPWSDYRADMGYEEVVSGKRKPITNSDGVKIKKQWPLGGSGAKKANADDEPAILEFQPYREASFAVWNFS